MTVIMGLFLKKILFPLGHLPEIKNINTQVEKVIMNKTNQLEKNSMVNLVMRRHLSRFMLLQEE